MTCFFGLNILIKNFSTPLRPKILSFQETFVVFPRLHYTENSLKCLYKRWCSCWDLSGLFKVTDSYMTNIGTMQVGKYLKVFIWHHRNWWNIFLFLTIITFSKDFGSEKNAEHFSHNSVRGCSYFYSYAGNAGSSHASYRFRTLLNFFFFGTYLILKLVQNLGMVKKRIASSILTQIAYFPVVQCRRVGLNFR